ncbi:hypothetical protein FACS1894145_2640 [Bacteroidia bacterium]|nr:hypothetical protein FACS1894145_2640 [Bacteroidia bacterium]
MKTTAKRELEKEIIFLKKAGWEFKISQERINCGISILYIIKPPDNIQRTIPIKYDYNDNASEYCFTEVLRGIGKIKKQLKLKK